MFLSTDCTNGTHSEGTGGISMRKVVLLVLASLMLMGGLCVLLFGHKYIIAGAVIAFAGGYLIWADFITTWED